MKYEVMICVVSCFSDYSGQGVLTSLLWAKTRAPCFAEKVIMVTISVILIMI